MWGRDLFTLFTAVKLILVIWQRMLLRPPMATCAGCGTCPVFTGRLSWASSWKPGSPEGQSEMRPTILPCSIFCLIFSKLIAIEAWAGAWCVAINSMCLILTIFVFLIKINWIYRCCLCGWIFKWHLRRGKLQEGNLTPVLTVSFLAGYSLWQREKAVFPQAQWWAWLLASSRIGTWPDPALT